MRYLFYISMVMLSLMITSCGSGRGSSADSVGNPNETTVMINLGQRNINTGAHSAQAIPPEVGYIVIRISAPGESTIEQVVDISEGVESVEVVLIIPNGLWHFEVFAYDDTDTLRCYGDTYVNLDGTPVTITITVVCVADETPPTFNGLETAEAFSETSIGLSWTAATDDVTPSSAILYLIYMSPTSGGQDFAAPSFITPAGATTHTVTGLSSLTTLCFVVRAKDEAGNIDSNTEERCATTFSPPPPPIQEYTLTVTLAGNGSGTVTSDPSGIDCGGGFGKPESGAIVAPEGGDCSDTYDEGTEVMLTATPDEGSIFAGWSGDCETGGIEVEVDITMDDNKECTATFEYQEQAFCNDEVQAGGDTPEIHTVELGQSSGTFLFEYQTYFQEDQMIVIYEGSTLFDTGCLGTEEWSSESISYSGESTQVTVEVIPNCLGGFGTLWDFIVNCP